MKNGKQPHRDGKPFCRDSKQHYRAPKNAYSEKKGTARGKVEFITDVTNLARLCDKDCCSGIKDIGGYKWGIKLGKPGPNVCVYLVCEHKANNLLCDAKVKFSLIGKKEYCHKCQYEISGGNVSSEYKCVFPIKYSYVTDTSNGLVDSKGNVTIRAEIYETCYEHPDGFTDGIGEDDAVKLAENSLKKMQTSIQTFKDLISSGAFTALDCRDARYYAESLEKIATSLKELENEVVEATSCESEEKSWKESNDYKDSSNSGEYCTFVEKRKSVVAEVKSGSILFVSNIHSWIFPLMLSSKKVQIAGAELCLIVEQKLNNLCAYIHCKPQLSDSTFDVKYTITVQNSQKGGLVEKGLAVFGESTDRSAPFLLDWKNFLVPDAGWVNCLGQVSFDVELCVMRMTMMYVFAFWLLVRAMLVSVNDLNALRVDTEI